MSVHDPGYRPSGWGTAGDHEGRIRKLEATPGNLTVTDGGVTVDPTTEIFVGPGLSLTNPGAGVGYLAVDNGGVIGWLAADVPRASGGLTDSMVGIYPYVANWDSAVTESEGAPCGTLSTASGLVLPSGNFLVTYSAWSNAVAVRPHMLWTFVTSSEIRYVQSSTSDTSQASYVGAQTVFATLTGSKTLTCGVDTFGGGDPTADSLVTMFIMRFS